MFFRIQAWRTTWRVTAHDAACWRSFLSWIFALFGLQPAHNSMQQIWRGFEQWTLIISFTTKGDKASSFFFFFPWLSRSILKHFQKRKQELVVSILSSISSLSKCSGDPLRGMKIARRKQERPMGVTGKCKSACSLHASIVRFKPVYYCIMRNQSKLKCVWCTQPKFLGNFTIHYENEGNEPWKRACHTCLCGQRAKEEAHLGRGFVSVAK